LNCPSTNSPFRFGVVLWSAIFWALCLAPYGAAQAKRIALVIGNDQYRHVAPLEKAGNDALAMGRELQAAGFEVRQYRDLDFKAMVRAVTGMVGSISGGDEVVIFFAGHGVQTRGGAYLLPTDIEATNEAEVERTSYSLEDLSAALAQAKPAFSLVIIDACRDNPLRSKTSSERAIGASRGLNPVDPPKGQIVIYSAGRGQQALDRLGNNDKNPNGVFTREFIARMKRPGVRIQDLVDEVGEAVEKLARTVNHDQSPAIYNQARGSFYFFAPSVVINQPAPAAPPPPPTNTGFSVQQLEERFWDGTVIVGNDAAFQAYLKAYPQGRYADLAKAKLSPGATQGASPSSTPPLASGSAVRAQPRSENAPISAPTNDAKTVEPGWSRINGRYLGKGDEVFDEKTRLVWKRCAEGMKWTGEACEGTALRLGAGAAFVRAQNIAKEAGIGWRLPDREELITLVDKSAVSAKINSSVFPGTPAFFFWIANPSAQFFAIERTSALNFDNGFDALMANSSPMHVRLVRTYTGNATVSQNEIGPSARPDIQAGKWLGPLAKPSEVSESLDWIKINGRFLAKGDEVLDQSTKLIWKRCPEGMRWTGESCEGTVQRYGWSRAALRAQEISKAEGLPWTLPEADDLKALVERSAGPVKIDTKAFPGTPAYYFWSANPFPSAVIKTATAINFEDGIGSSFSDSSLMHVRLVRRQ
jgi:hypothetical protein